MGVYIKGMEMPNNCETCNFYVYRKRGYYVCVATPLPNVINIMESNNGRRDFCPLIHVPTPHGRLSDIDKMIDDYWNGNYMRIGEAELTGIQTIIEAERNNI